ncbi:MAG: hypothetical protein ABFD46_03245 [Armatimonadota bacterium]
MTRQTRIVLLGLIVVMLAASYMCSIPMDRLKYAPGAPFRSTDVLTDKDTRKTSLLFDMSLQFMGAAAMGMREAVASVLWARADEFFHSGEFEAILPIVRVVTWLDPHQLDVYSTGSWHLDYNFVDQEQRSDRRYIPPAIALLKEGISNNPDVYDLYFELGWMHYQQKLKDYSGAAKWLEESSKRGACDPNTGARLPRPAFIDRMVAHAYERVGDIDRAEVKWRETLRAAEERARKKNDYSNQQDVSICKRNLGLMLLRYAWRTGDLSAYKRGLDIFDSIKQPDLNEARAVAAARKHYAGLVTSGKTKIDTLPPVDAKFNVTWKKLKPGELLISGTVNLVPAEEYKGLASEPFTQWYKTNQSLPADRRAKWQSGARLRILLADMDYDYFHMKGLNSFDWEVDKTQTVMMDDTGIREGKFSITIDMSLNPEKYPFTKDKYRLSVWMNPQEAPDFIQDRIGWLGEGLTDKHYLDTKTIPGVRILRKDFILKKSDIL